MTEVDISEVDIDISLPEVVVEDANTIDTLNFDEVKSFIASVDGMEVIGDGIRLWVLMNRRVYLLKLIHLLDWVIHRPRF